MVLTQKPSPLVFFHIPKTGGTAIHDLLSKEFSSSRICPERLNNLNKMGKQEILKYDLFSGHFDRNSIRRLPNRPRVITVLREPKSRVLSLYYYWKSHRSEVVEERNLVGPRLAHKYNLLEFLRCPTPSIAPNIDNVHVRSMLGHMWVGPNREFRVADEIALKRAKTYLNSLFDYGIMEDLDSFVARVFPRLGFTVPAKVPRRNAHEEFSRIPWLQAIEREEVTPEIDAELERLTYLDQRLYRYACEQLASRKP